MTRKRLITPLMTDFYKVGHPFQYHKDTTLVCSNYTCRGSRIKGVDKTVFFGLQYFIKEYLIDHFNEYFFNVPKEEVLRQYDRVTKHTIGGVQSNEHIAKLHDTGYLPLEIKGLPEGTRVPLRTPSLTIINTNDESYWLVNAIETLLSTSIWLPITSATTADRYKQLFKKVLLASIGDDSFVNFMGHDFSMRGMASCEAAVTSGMAHLTSFMGTDTVPAVFEAEHYYNCNIEEEIVGVSVAATEHAVMSSNIAIVESTLDMPEGRERQLEAEKILIERFITELYPSGIVSIVSDTFNLWDVLTYVLPELKDEIEARDGKVVIRPDSGDPVDIICGEEMEDYTAECTLENLGEYVKEDIEECVRNETPHGECGELNPSKVVKHSGKAYLVVLEIMWNRHDKQYYYMDGTTVDSVTEVELSPERKGVVELLWDTFGGTEVNGYKVLSDKVGAIYGDSITIERAEQISKRLMAKGFAPIIVYGIGSYTYQYVTRDTFGQAMKATYTECGDKKFNIYKDPITDDGLKKSAKGLIRVNEDLSYDDEVTMDEYNSGALQVVFKDGKMVKEYSLSEIRELLNK